MRASDKSDRATHEQSPQAVSAVPVGIPSADVQSALCALSQRERDVLWLIPAQDDSFSIGPRNRYANELIRLSHTALVAKIGRFEEDRYRLTLLGLAVHRELKRQKPDWLEARR